MLLLRIAEARLVGWQIFFKTSTFDVTDRRVTGGTSFQNIVAM